MSKQEQKIIPVEGTRLFVDIGNSSIKAAIDSNGGWKHPEESGLQRGTDLLEWISDYQKHFDLIVIISVVEKVTQAFVNSLEEGRYRILTIHDIPDDLIDYETPDTLGLDRFFGCYGAVAHSNKPVVVIDAGTACTIDYMTDGYVYRGGVIMPGFSIVESSVKNQLSSLPRVPRELPDVWPGKSSKTSLQWGISGAFEFSIERMLERYEEMFDTFELVVTGGDAETVIRLIDREAKNRPDLVFEGMKRFLEDYI